VSFGLRSAFGGVILNGILTGAAVLGGAGGGVGTGGPLEAGTLSEADAPVPFGGSVNGILVGAVVGSAAGAGAASVLGVNEIGRRDVPLGVCFSCATGSGSALAIARAVAGSTFTGGFALVCNGARLVPNFLVS